MSKYPITVEKADGSILTKPAVVAVSFVLFFLLGVVLGSAFYPLRLPSTMLLSNLKSFTLGAVGALGGEGDEIVVTQEPRVEVPLAVAPEDASTSDVVIQQEEDVPSESPALEIIPAEPAPEVPVYMTLRGAELDQYILDQKAYIEKLTRDIDRIRNTSINRTAEFARNCNNWNGYCANEYRTDLDNLNREYNRMLIVLDAANIALSNAVERQSTIIGY